MSSYDALSNRDKVCRKIVYGTGSSKNETLVTECQSLFFVLVFDCSIDSLFVISHAVVFRVQVAVANIDGTAVLNAVDVSWRTGTGACVIPVELEVL
jgi:hypothetical protein